MSPPGGPSTEGVDGAASPAAEWRQAVHDAEATGPSAEKLVALHAALASHVSSLLLEHGFLRCCLRAKGYDVKKAEALALNYLAFRRRARWHHEAFGGGSPASVLRPVRASCVEAELRSGVNLLLPTRDVYGHVVLTQRMGLLDKCTSIEALQRAAYYLLHRVLQRAGAQTGGLALLLDFSGFGWRAFRQVGLADVQRGVAMLQDGFPARLALIYVLHPPPWLHAVVRLLKPWLRRDSLRQKFVLLRSAAELHAFVPPAALPAGVDGWGGVACADAWRATVDGWLAEEAGDAAFDPISLLRRTPGDGIDHSGRSDMPEPG